MVQMGMWAAVSGWCKKIAEDSVRRPRRAPFLGGSSVDRSFPGVMWLFPSLCHSGSSLGMDCLRCSFLWLARCLSGIQNSPPTNLRESTFCPHSQIFYHSHSLYLYRLRVPPYLSVFLFLFQVSSNLPLWIYLLTHAFLRNRLATTCKLSCACC